MVRVGRERGRGREAEGAINVRSLAYQFAGNLKIVDMNANAELKG